MKSKISKPLAVAFAILTLATVFTSCSRGGYGCPYELEMPKIAVPTIK